MQPNHELAINTVVVVHQRTYLATWRVSKKTYGDAWEWFAPTLSAMAQKARIVPMVKSDAQLLGQGLEGLAAMPQAQELMSTPAEQWSTDDVRSLFSGLEKQILASKASTYQGLRMSSLTRRFILDCLRQRGQADLAERARRLFRSQIESAQKGRELISDMPMPGRAPISAISFTTYTELKEASRDVLQRDLERISECCTDVLDRYDKALGYLDRLRGLTVSERKAEELLSKPLVSQGRPKLCWSESDFDTFLALLLRDQRSQSALHGKLRKHPEGLNEHIRSKLEGLSNGASVDRLLQMHIAPSAEVLLACALIIQIHTHWNFISVLELTVDEADVRVFPHKLQSIKPRTSDETPPVFVERSDELVIRALNILVERWRRLVAAHIIPASSRALWFSSRGVLSGKEPWPVVSWAAVLRPFTEHYGLPRFALEQVRVQCLATIAVGDRGLPGVMQSAGHAELATSLHYVDKLLLRRLNAANALEFERRLERTVLYMMGKAGSDEGLIAYPLGDGASCRNPKAPPTESWLEGALCKGERCHAGDEGCPNRVLLITEERIEEVVRTKDYYMSNWNRLANENCVRFEQVQFPHMLFTLALFGILKRGPYRHLVARHESRS